ncbi:enoyl-CoA hydratase-related protein [Archaeoglobus sp.]
MSVISESLEGVRIITLNRPEKKNALTSEMLEKIRNEIVGCKEEVVILRGNGDSFCAGHDFNEVVESAEEHFETCRKLMFAMRESEKVVITSVRGYAVAGGCQLVAVSDLAVASENAKFGLTGIRFGLFCYTPLVFVSRCIGIKRAFELAFTGELIDAKTALEWGLVNKVVPDERLEEETLNLAKKIAEHSEVIGRAKRFFYDQIEMETLKAFNYGVSEIVNNVPLARESILKFLRKA